MSSASSADGVDAAFAAPSASSVVVLSPMLRLLGRDGDAQFVLMQFCDWSSLAALFGTCSAWGSWLAAPNGALRRDLSLRSADFLRLRQVSCRWPLKHVARLAVRPNDDEPSVDAGSADAVSHQLELQSVLRHLHLCPRVTAAQVHTHAWKLDAKDTKQCFNHMAAQLTVFELHMHAPAGPVLHMALQHVGRLQRLESLAFSLVSIPRGVRGALSFAELKLLPRLQSFQLLLETELGDPFSCTRAQVRDLAACKQLRVMLAGYWGTFNAGDGDQSDPDAEMESLVFFVKERCRYPDAVPLQKLCLPRERVNHATWTWISRLTGLEMINWRWEADITPEDWMMLVPFKQLRFLHIRAPGHGLHGPILTEHFLPAFCLLTSIETLQLGAYFRISSEQIAQLVTSLPRMHSLDLETNYLEDLSALARAPALTSLCVYKCNDWHDHAFPVRTALPAMPLLQSLTIVEPTAARMSAEEVATLNAELLERMPMLTLDKIEQTLLTPEEVAARQTGPVA